MRSLKPSRGRAPDPHNSRPLHRISWWVAAINRSVAQRLCIAGRRVWMNAVERRKEIWGVYGRHKTNFLESRIYNWECQCKIISSKWNRHNLIKLKRAQVDKAFFLCGHALFSCGTRLENFSCNSSRTSTSQLLFIRILLSSSVGTFIWDSSWFPSDANRYTCDEKCNSFKIQ